MIHGNVFFRVATGVLCAGWVLCLIATCTTYWAAVWVDGVLYHGGLFTCTPQPGQDCDILEAPQKLEIIGLALTAIGLGFLLWTALKGDDWVQFGGRICISGGICSTVGVICYGVWVDTSLLSWSFALATVGSVFTIMAACVTYFKGEATVSSAYQSI